MGERWQMESLSKTLARSEIWDWACEIWAETIETSKRQSSPFRLLHQVPKKEIHDEPIQRERQLIIYNCGHYIYIISLSRGFWD